jgi:hypothetical protein
MVAADDIGCAAIVKEFLPSVGARHLSHQLDNDAWLRRLTLECGSLLPQIAAQASVLPRQAGTPK